MKQKNYLKTPFRNLFYLLSEVWKEYRAYLFLLFGFALVNMFYMVVTPFLYSSAINAVVEEQERVKHLVILGILLLVVVLCDIFGCYLDRHINLGCWRKFLWIFEKKLIIKQIDTDYENLEVTANNDKLQKAWDSIGYGFDDGMFALYIFLRDAVALAVSGTVLFTLHPLILMIVTVAALATFVLSRVENNWVIKHTSDWTPYTRKMSYLARQSMDFTRGKDIRLFRMRHFLTDAFRDVFKKRYDWGKKADRVTLLLSIARAFVISLCIGGAHAFAVWQVYIGEISAGSFVLYFNMIENYFYSVTQLAEYMSRMLLCGNKIGFLREYLAIPDKTNRKTGKPLPTESISIVFDHVSYTYHGASKETLHDICFTLHPGEKLALVGLNGAGKTTLIKLLCGLYDPTEGEILLNGVPVREYNREEYFDLFSAVFQDFEILPVTIEKNIMQTEDVNEAICSDALNKAGLLERIAELPQGAKTRLAKSVFDDATDFSGGERQKLALARAICKDAPVLLLDEPTAALDPISEQEMYLQYVQFSEGKSSIFISHRLASTRFCSRILVLENGSIMEEGSHEELLKRNGVYASLYKVQSAYYQEEQRKEALRIEAEGKM